MSPLYTLHVPASDQSRTHAGQNIFVFLSSFSSPGLGVSLQAWPAADQWPYYEQHFNDFSRKHLFCPSRQDISAAFCDDEGHTLVGKWQPIPADEAAEWHCYQHVPSIVRVQAVTVTRPRPSLTPDSTPAQSLHEISRVCSRQNLSPASAVWRSLDIEYSIGSSHVIISACSISAAHSSYLLFRSWDG